MQVTIRNKIDQFGKRGKRLEGKILRSAGEVVAKGISDNINRSRGGEGYKHLADNIVVSNVKTNAYGERSVEISSIKELGYRLKFLEFGTSKMSAQAPMTIGAETSKSEVAQILSIGMKGIMKL